GGDLPGDPGVGPVPARRPGGLRRPQTGAGPAVMNLATVLLGPLVVPECRRSAARGWPIVARTLAALLAALVTLWVVWFWWFSQTFDAGYSPFSALRGGLIALEGMAVTVALVLSPAVLAG